MLFTGSHAIVIARGVALFFGAFSFLNAAVAVLSRRHEDVWWVDLSVFPGPLSWAAGLVAAIVLVEFALRPEMTDSRRQLTTGVCATLAGIAVLNSISFYRALQAGSITSGIGWPFSIVLASTFLWLAAIAWFERPGDDTRARRVGMVAVALLVAMLFPLAQVAFFGSTDYRRPADVVVVPGARVNDDGSLSGSLADRVLTAAELWKLGLAPRLIMSGGTGANGMDEASAMKAFAVAQGVPADAIDTDSAGVDTDATVRNTVAMMPGTTRVLVVSQFYHLPRLKLAYRTVGRDVLTVPARETLPIPKTPLFVAREIPGFWVYWARAAWRDVVGAAR